METLKRIWVYLKKLNIEVPMSWIGSKAIRKALRGDHEKTI